MDTLKSIKVFRQVVDSGGFGAAAERLDMSTAMVSKHVKSIEQRLGVRLLNRNTRSLSLTELGRVYFERCSSILDELQATEVELGSQSGTPCGTLRITAPSLGTGHWLADLLADFHHRHPRVLVEVSCEDRLVNLVESGYDVALRIASGPDSLPRGVIARPLRPMTFYLAASREYIKRRGRPNCPEDLHRHDFIAVGNLLDSLPRSASKPGTSAPVHVALRYRSMDGAASAAAAGIGIAPVPAALFEDPLFKNVLEQILPDHPLQEARLYALYTSRKLVPLKLRAFVDFITGFFGGVAAQEPCPHVGAAVPTEVEHMLGRPLINPVPGPVCFEWSTRCPLTPG